MKRALCIAAPLLLMAALITTSIWSTRDRRAAEEQTKKAWARTHDLGIQLNDLQAQYQKCKEQVPMQSDMQRVVSPGGMQCRVTCTVVGAAKGSGMAGKR